MTQQMVNSVLERCEHIRALSDVLGLLVESALDTEKYSGSIDFVSGEISKEVRLIENELRFWHSNCKTANDNN